MSTTDRNEASKTSPWSNATSSNRQNFSSTKASNHKTATIPYRVDLHFGSLISNKMPIGPPTPLSLAKPLGGTKSCSNCSIINTHNATNGTSKESHTLDKACNTYEGSQLDMGAFQLNSARGAMRSPASGRNLRPAVPGSKNTAGRAAVLRHRPPSQALETVLPDDAFRSSAGHPLVHCCSVRPAGAAQHLPSGSTSNAFSRSPFDMADGRFL